MRTTFGGGSDGERDRLRSESDRLRANDLELRSPARPRRFAVLALSGPSALRTL